MEKDIFTYRDYKSYLNTLIAARPGRGRGMKSAMAEALSCQTSYVSQVLNENAHFSLEQADRLNSYLGHSAEESSFFLLLVQLARAGTPSLRKHWEREIESLVAKRLVLRERLDVRKTLSREDQTTYYSSWLYSVIHMMLTIPQFRDKEAIARHLAISPGRVSDVLNFLVSIGLAKVSKGQYIAGESQIFLGSDSPLISKHHINWRLQAIRSVEKDGGGDDLHYSSTWSISEKDFNKVKSLLVKSLDDARQTLKHSKEEEIICLNLDFFRI